MKKPGIRENLVKLFRKNVDDIFCVMRFTQADLANQLNLSRVSVNKMISNKDHYLSVVQFLGSLQGIKEMIEESDADDRKKRLAMEYWKEIHDNYLEGGLY